MSTSAQRRRSYMLSNEVLYNVMRQILLVWAEEPLHDESLSNKLFMKKQLCSLRLKEGTSILQHLNAFNRILSDLLALEVKI